MVFIPHHEQEPGRVQYHFMLETGPPLSIISYWKRLWLDPKTPLPEDRELAEVFTSAPTNRSVSSAAPFREQILAWHGQGITATATHQALVRKYRFTGSVHTIYRLLDRVIDSLFAKSA